MKTGWNLPFQGTDHENEMWGEVWKLVSFPAMISEAKTLDYFVDVWLVNKDSKKLEI